jgi:hypothetical protein
MLKLAPAAGRAIMHTIIAPQNARHFNDIFIFIHLHFTCFSIGHRLCLYETGLGYTGLTRAVPRQFKF